MVTSSHITLTAGLLLALSASVAVGAPAGPKQALPYRPGEVLVKFKPGTGPDAKARALGQVRGRPARKFKRFGIEKWKLPPGSDVRETARRLKASGQVEFAEPNFIRRPRAVPNDLDSRLWGLDNTGETVSYDAGRDPGNGLAGADMDLPRAWDLQSEAASVIIAVVDNGVLLNHEDLTDNIWVNPGEVAGNNIDDDDNGYKDDVNGWDFADNDAEPVPGSGELHGSAVAGAAGAVGNNGAGITSAAQRVKIMPLRTDYSIGQLIAAYEYAAANGADIINASFGGLYSQSEFEAIEALIDDGVLLIAAAGNGGYSNDAIPDAPSGYDLPNILSVAASHPQDGLSIFTQVGATSVDVAAPGSSIYTTKADGGYGFVEGTSFSTPYAGSVAALLKAYREAQGDEPLDFREMKGRLMAGVNTLFTGKLATDGRVNAYKAMTVSPQPVLVVAGWRIDDSAGNGNGAMDPGESIRLVVTLSNEWRNAGNVSATLRSLTPEVTVVEASDSLPAGLLSGKKAQVSFGIRLAEAAAAYQQFPLELSLSADGMSVARHFALAFGPLDLRSGSVRVQENLRQSNDQDSGYWDQLHTYHFEVPKEARNLKVTLSSSDPDSDIDVLLRHAARPEPQYCYWLGPPGCLDDNSLVSAGDTSDERIGIAEPSPGLYHITVIAYRPRIEYANTDVPYTLGISFDKPSSGGGGGGALLWLLLALLPVWAVQRRVTNRR